MTSPRLREDEITVLAVVTVEHVLPLTNVMSLTEFNLGTSLIVSQGYTISVKGDLN